MVAADGAAGTMNRLGRRFVSRFNSFVRSRQAGRECSEVFDMTTSRAEEVAEVLWELKRADKVATFSAIAGRAGFSAGANGKSLMTCLKTVRRDWPHLQWWRAIKDDRLVEKDSEHEAKLRESGFDIEETADEKVTLTAFEEHVMNWDEGAQGQPVSKSAPDGDDSA